MKHLKKTIFTVMVVSFLRLNLADCSPEVYEEVSTKISFLDHKDDHIYSLVKTLKGKPVFKLVFQEGKAPPRVKEISEGEAEAIRNESIRIVWTQLYRKKEISKKCLSAYARITANGESANICTENTKATAMAQGLLNDLSQNFK